MCVFDGGVNLMLVVGFGIGQVCWYDFVVFLDEVFQGVYVFVIDLFNVSGGEMVEFFVFEQWVLLLVFVFQFVFIEFFIECYGWFLYLKLGKVCLVILCCLIWCDWVKINDMKYDVFVVVIFVG